MTVFLLHRADYGRLQYVRIFSMLYASGYRVRRGWFCSILNVATWTFPILSRYSATFVCSTLARSSAPSQLSFALANHSLKVTTMPHSLYHQVWLESEEHVHVLCMLIKTDLDWGWQWTNCTMNGRGIRTLCPSIYPWSQRHPIGSAGANSIIIWTLPDRFGLLTMKMSRIEIPLSGLEDLGMTCLLARGTGAYSNSRYFYLDLKFNIGVWSSIDST